MLETEEIGDGKTYFIHIFKLLPLILLIDKFIGFVNVPRLFLGSVKLFREKLPFLRVSGHSNNSPWIKSIVRS